MRPRGRLFNGLINIICISATPNLGFLSHISDRFVFSEEVSAFISLLASEVICICEM